MTKTYPTAVVLSLTTQRLLCAFPEMHDLAEYLTGGEVWTHQFAHRPFVEELRDALYQQHPALRAADARAVTTENWQAFRDREVARLGPTLAVTPMRAVQTFGDAFTEPLALIGTARQE